ncbi:hypothetical protein LTR53_018386 [Teratosphaeriaceae sp. CCFEE 6253]|nr:hypothetical protein LTR53_018386 [Teratosphaeriaceae sp. CCFEE 6253]
MFSSKTKLRKEARPWGYDKLESRMYTSTPYASLPDDEDEIDVTKERVGARSREHDASSRSTRDVDDILSYLFDDEDRDDDEGNYDSDEPSSPAPELDTFPGASTARAPPGATATNYTDLGYGIPEVQPRRPSPYGGPSQSPSEAPTASSDNRPPQPQSHRCDGCDARVRRIDPLGIIS